MQYRTVQSQKFADEYPVDINTLGSFYTKEKTLFRVYSPMAKSMLLRLGMNSYEMKRLPEGVFETVVAGDHERSEYCYINDSGISFSDPFSYCDSYDRKRSFVLDANKLKKEKIKPKSISYLETVVYETSVRDFSSDPNLPCHHPRKFLALIEEGLVLNGEKVGFDHLLELGITHLQLMPVFDFDLDRTEYNWGYNPLSYNSLYQGYCVANDPYEIISELRTVADHLHKKDLRLVLDVVFNHVFDIRKTALGKSLPGYCVRYTSKGEMANGTYCGNEIRSEASFVRDYLKLMVKRYIEIYDIDGLRFDLMGILDIDTVNSLAKTAKELKQDFLLLGEAWNMGDVLQFEERACMENHEKMPSFHFFNNRFRDSVKRFCADRNEDRSFIGNVLTAISSNLPINQTVNYVECHDNATYNDYLLMNCPNDSYETIRAKAKLALGMTILSRGIPFIHSGQEFGRTKKMIDNTYNCGDEINMLDWSLVSRNHDVFEYAKKLLQIRRHYPCFRDEKAKVSFENYYEVLVYHLDELTILINPCIFDHVYHAHKSFRKIFGDNGFSDEITDTVEVKAHSLVILDNHTI